MSGRKTLTEERADRAEARVKELEEQLEALRDLLKEADEQLWVENEKHPNHNITRVRQKIAAGAGFLPGGGQGGHSAPSNPAKERQS